MKYEDLNHGDLFEYQGICIKDSDNDYRWTGNLDQTFSVLSAKLTVQKLKLVEPGGPGGLVRFSSMGRGERFKFGEIYCIKASSLLAYRGNEPISFNPGTMVQYAVQAKVSVADVTGFFRWGGVDYYRDGDKVWNLITLDRGELPEPWRMVTPLATVEVGMTFEQVSLRQHFTHNGERYFKIGDGSAVDESLEVVNFAVDAEVNDA